MDRDGVSPSARAVWWTIVAHANGEGEAWPKLDVLARMTGVSTRSVSACLRELEQVGLLETNRSHHQTNRYRILLSTSTGSTGSTVPDTTDNNLKHTSDATGSTLQGHRKQASDATGNDQLSDLPKRPLEVHSEVHTIEHSEVGDRPPQRAAMPPTFAAGTGEIRDVIEGTKYCGHCDSGWLYEEPRMATGPLGTRYLQENAVTRCPTCNPRP